MAETANPKGEDGSGALNALEPIPAFAGRAKSYANKTTAHYVKYNNINDLMTNFYYSLLKE
ncbi:hypothetical protein [Ruixingdingia sedimenti]|uniref:Uncharacterized protein n=1 Tax=Ruixingdingia sedimenti TaxID=3073604 RepID=A0ABU1FDX8_9RHOB|nr:hypothetical protein [Xinfangfangia sp. LG-4]MDR5655110.1 hypothetical protein [Xinfangfangia sp. LG-4]